MADAQMINIRRDVGDKFYRYKMPKIEGRGNGIKTVVPNMTDVARALNRSPAYVIKFFGSELGSQSTVDLKNDKYIVNGAHDAEKLQTTLDAFIQKFVLCPSCLNPETDLVITKTEDILRVCKACGASKPVDMRHKLVAYILKNPPPKPKKIKKPRTDQPDTAGTPEARSASQSVQGEDDDQDDFTKDPNAFAMPSAFAEDDWAEDTTPEAVAARMKELAINESVLDRAAGEDPLEKFAEFVLSSPMPSAMDIMDKASDLDVSVHKAAAVLPQILFDASISPSAIQKHSSLLQKFTSTEKAQKALLGGIERLCAVTHPELLPKIPAILKYIYDEDIVDEEVFLKWADRPSKKYVDKATSKLVREKAQPFLNWLREAEEEESDDDDDE